MIILMRNISTTLYTIDRVRRLDVDSSRLLVNEARSHADAVEGYHVIYEAVGLDKAYTNRIIARHR
ncbi:MAG: hypothetical protein ACXWOL_06865 [Ktedonobacteraceae bacterium]